MIQKAALRAEALRWRGNFPPAGGAAIGRSILDSLLLEPGTALAAVWPLPGEPDLRPLLNQLHELGHRVLLPQTPPRGHPLIFRRWSPGCTMLAERFGTHTPNGPIETPDLILVPLLAWDRAGGRLGYGGGYYDRTLAAHADCPRAGFGYSAQEVAGVPIEPHDCLLPVVFTEQGAIRTAAHAPAPLLRA